MTRPHVVRLELDRPGRANALDAESVERLHAGLAAADDAGADAVVLEARGRSFCSGLDLGAVDDETDATLLHRLVRVQLLLERVRDARAVVVAVVQGAAVGAGADLALSAHVRLALPGASLRFPGSGFGAVLGTSRLAAETSPSYAAEVALTGRPIDRDEAVAARLWQPVESHDQADAVVRRIAASAERLPRHTAVRLRAAAAPSPARDPLGDLVRSLVSEPGLAERARTYRARTTPSTLGARSPEGVPA